MDSIIYQRVKELCDENNISVTKLESAVGMSQYSITKWRDAVSPSADKILRVAKYFEVSVDYLMGVSNLRTPADKLTDDLDFISIQRARERMSDKDKTRMTEMLRICFDYAFSEKE